MQNDLEYVGYFVQWIHHAFKDWSSIPSLSKFFREGHKKNEILKELLEAMIVFGVAQCSLSSLLSAVEVVLAEAKMLSDVKLDISSVQKLRNWNGKDFRLAICSLSDLCAIYHLNLPVKNHEKASRSSHQLFKTTLPSEPWAFDKKFFFFFFFFSFVSVVSLRVLKTNVFCGLPGNRHQKLQHRLKI